MANSDSEQAQTTLTVIQNRPFNWMTDWPYLVVELGIVVLVVVALFVLILAAFRKRKQFPSVHK